MINTISHLCRELRIAGDELEYILSNLDRYYYRSESIKTKYGGPQTGKEIKRIRILHPSIGALKRIQKNIHKNILSRLPIPDYAYGSMKGKDNILNARQHLGNKYFFTVDLKSFFPSINIHMVYETFILNGFSPDVASILTRLTTYKGALPQGTPTSPLIANLVFVSTGAKILQLLKPYNITFTTFLDDFSFSSRSNLKHLVPKILKIIQADGYWISHKKVFYKTKSPEVTGITIEGNKLVPHSKIMEKYRTTNSWALNRYINQIIHNSKR
jgi:RNA-directed DNA polymerase